MQIFVPLLAVLFIGLKLADIIAWSWLWVLAPLWFGLVVAMVWIIIAVIILVARK